MKTIVLLAIILLYPATIYAQDISDFDAYRKKRFISKFELLGGPSLSFLRGNPSVDNNFIISRALKLGHSFGFGLTHPIDKNIELIGMILVERKGTIANHDDIYFDNATQTLKNGKVKEEYKYDYRSLPLIIVYSFGRKAPFQLGFGPYLSYLKSQIIKTTYYPQGVVGIEDQISFDKRWDFGCAIKFSCIIPLSQKISFQTQLLNLWGFANTRADPNYGIMKTNNTNLLFGIIIKR